MEISCKTCAYDLGETVLCGKPCDSEYSGWTPNIYAVQEDLDQAFTAFTDKIKTCYAEDARKDLDMCYEKSPLSDTQKKIAENCDEVKNTLLEKNRKYGDSAINPKRVLIVNGVARSGKDHFVDVLSMHKGVNLLDRMSTVDRVKQLALQMGCDIERKNEADRKLMSDIKLAWTTFNDGVFHDLRNRIGGAFKKASTGLNVITVMCREPEEIAKFVAFYGKRICRTVLIKRPGIEVPNNMADEGVDEYDYDYVIDNDGSFEEFETNIDLLSNLLILEGFMGDGK